jgi:hypothetical protein
MAQIKLNNVLPIPQIKANKCSLHFSRYPWQIMTVSLLKLHAALDYVLHKYVHTYVASRHTDGLIIQSLSEPAPIEWQRG